MLKRIVIYIQTLYRIDSEDELRRFISLIVISAVGLITSLGFLLKDVVSLYVNENIPGDVSLLLLFVIFSYNLYFRKRVWAINTVFLLPFVAYFYYISNDFSIYPLPDSISRTLWVLLPGFLFLALFALKTYKIFIYFLLTLSTLLYHLFLAQKLDTALEMQWSLSEKNSNPLFLLTASFLATFFISWYYQRTIRRLKQEAEDIRERIKKAFQNTPQGIMLLQIQEDEFGIPESLLVTRVNHAFESIFKVSSRDLAGKEVSLMFPRLFRGAFDWNDVYLMSKKKKYEFYIEHLDRWFEVYNIKPDRQTIISTFYDVSLHHRSIDLLKESRRRFQVLVEAIPDLFFIIDKDGLYVDFVVKEAEGLRIDPDEIIGNSIYEVGFSERMSRKIYQCIQDCIRFDSIETIEYALEIEAGTAMFEMRLAKLNEESVISVARDITKRKVAEMQLEKAKIKAEDADRLKSAFLANISHEIRTPMNAIIGFSRMLSSGDFNMDEKNRFLEIIITNGKLLMGLINDMISLSKIESDQIDVVKSNCMVNDMLVLMYKDFLLEIEDDQEVVLKLKNENANPKFSIYTDQSLLKEILEKLIDNALKFTEKGFVEFGYRTLPNGNIEFFVKDTGIGIDMEDQEKIFARFHQIDNKTTRSYEGTGLGLSIAQHYVMLLGGELKVVSTPGNGSSFYFSIPAETTGGHLKIVR